LQFEDVSHDMKCYVDEEGHSYDFAYGMNYSGVIRDNRVKNVEDKGGNQKWEENILKNY